MRWLFFYLSVGVKMCVPFPVSQVWGWCDLLYRPFRIGFLPTPLNDESVCPGVVILDF